MSDLGPIIPHDGAAPADFRVGRRIIIFYSWESGSIAAEGGGDISADYPGFYWRWRWVREGLFGRRRIRICDDPAYRPVIAFQYRKPRGLAILEGILAEAEAVGPVVPVQEDQEAKLSGPASPVARICLGRAQSPVNWRSAALKLPRCVLSLRGAHV